MVHSSISQKIGDPIPNNTAHAVSVTLPTWEATVGYEEGEDWVVNKMRSGYPRFFIHEIIQRLALSIEEKYARAGERAMIFPLETTAKRCRDFVKEKSSLTRTRRILQLNTPPPKTLLERLLMVECTIACVLIPGEEFHLAKQYWQHAGEGILSRMAEYVWKQLFGGGRDRSRTRTKQELQAQSIQRKSSLILALIRSDSSTQSDVDREFTEFIEQKYGRVLDLQFATQAKIALRRRIAGKAEAGSRGESITPEDVYLHPSGMAAIFNAHQAILSTMPPHKSVCFGFPYVDTLNILRKFGPGCIFYGFGDDKSLDELERKLPTEPISGFFCECPSNPLLKTPNLRRIRKLADKYNFAVVVDETVGNFLNILVLPYADMVVSSLTKIFSGDSNVMGGSLILNPATPMYTKLKEYFNAHYEDNFWAEDALYLERNLRDFEDRSITVNSNSLAVVDLLKASPLIADVYYPLLSDSKKYYDEVKTPEGGYGGLISFVLKDPKLAPALFNSLDLHKGPSLGTNFSLACPYTILAHYQELDEVAEWGVDRNLIRISIGIEDRDELLQTLQATLDEVAETQKQSAT